LALVRRALFWLPLVLAIAIAVVVPASALASVSYTDSVRAVETGFQPGVAPGADASSFAGLLSGGLPGVFTASVLHAPNPTTVGASAPILPGGRFSLTSFFTGTSLTGAFTGGSVTLAAQAEGCGEQVFRIQANLGGLTGMVSRTPVVAGTATFNGWLLHFRAPALTSAGAACQTFFATVTGLPPDGSVFPRGGAFFTFG
jgi:hypothetical protein